MRALAEADLAGMIGASRESVSRPIAAREMQGIPRGGPRRVEVIDAHRLAELAHEPHAWRRTEEREEAPVSRGLSLTLRCGPGLVARAARS
ncbi:MAG: winged helix-turn-helix domain-containing protein [Chloroflexi bacterium]|nr:winged helix-turn-helix domain-containing protein [Chloroflexota bacterium]